MNEPAADTPDRGVPGVHADLSNLVRQAQDAVLLCTDGLTNMLSDDRIATIPMADTESRRCARAAGDGSQCA